MASLINITNMNAADLDILLGNDEADAAEAALAANIEPVRREALRVNDGYDPGTEALVEGVIDTLKGVMTLAEMADDPAGAVAEFLDITSYSRGVTAQMGY